MARPGVGVEKIVEAIKTLEAEGHEVSVTAVRQRLGKTGSFSTIGPVVTEWRDKRAKETRAPVPEPSDSVRGLFTRLWAEAWAEAMKVHEPERQAFARDREEYQRGKGEMLSEITRLEAEIDAQREQTNKALAELTAERDRYRAELDQVRGSLAASEGALGEARKRIAEEEQRYRDLSAESAKAQALLGSAEGALGEARDQVKREEERNRELAERVIAEAAKAQSLAARLAELDDDRKQPPSGKAK
jgi:DNA repair exonuclease SbcCD ATPase subunit